MNMHAPERRDDEDGVDQKYLASICVIVLEAYFCIGDICWLRLAVFRVL